MPDLVPIRRALISVSDKSDLVPFARALAARGVQIISTGGTAAALSDAGLPVMPIEQLTGFPEMLSGRVKTLHPMVHGALLGLRDDPQHARQMAQHRIEPIDLVCVNLYPFERTISRPGVQMHEAIEQIDIGGPSMIRSAAKNYGWVTVVTAVSQYDRVISELAANDGQTTHRLRAELAASAFGRVSEYDAAIASYLGRASITAFPQVLRLGYVKVDELRYGENPHQEAALYRDPASTGPTIVNAQQLHGKDLSYNNILDASAALELVKAMRRLDGARCGAAVIKHMNPCGAACADTLADAVSGAISGDAIAAYGGILAVNRTLDAAAAEIITAEDRFFEVVIAPEFDESALRRLRGRWANVRLLAVGERAGSATRKLQYRSIPGGMLVQDLDNRLPDTAMWRHAAGPAVADDVLRDAAMLSLACRAVSSNAVVIGGALGGALRVCGVGAGQMDRLAACRFAVAKAGDAARGAIAVSDGFFPFADGPRLLIDAGVKMIVHPGGSKRDEETIALCQERGVTCIITGVRAFRH